MPEGLGGLRVPFSSSGVARVHEALEICARDPDSTSGSSEANGGKEAGLDPVPNGRLAEAEDRGDLGDGKELIARVRRPQVDADL